jgi:serine/threonine-protein phosphatase 2A activator
MKLIKAIEDVDLWLQSPAFFELQIFLSKLFSSIKGRTLTEIEGFEPSMPDIYGKLLKLLQGIDQLVNEIELIPSDQRYGNKAFRTLITRVREEILHEAFIEYSDDSDSQQYLTELLIGSFGDATRIDYGTGHELSFLIFVLVILQLSSPNDSKDDLLTEQAYSKIAGILIGQKYLKLVRKIQARYNLEPAGSHGVWGLDDHQFIPFLLGSSQLIGFDERFPPSSLMDPAVFSQPQLQKDFLYPAALSHIHQLKTRQNPSLKFYHHSPLLYDISAIPTWQRIHDGLKRMYLKEVLSKFPVVQHILFHEKLFKFSK